jgi:hypothetical protein
MALDIGGREFIFAPGGATAAWPLTTYAQEVGKLPTVGFAERAGEIAAEFALFKVDVIVTAGDAQVLAAKRPRSISPQNFKVCHDPSTTDAPSIGAVSYLCTTLYGVTATRGGDFALRHDHLPCDQGRPRHRE